MELPTKRVKEGVSCRALLSLESLLKKLKGNPLKVRLVRDVYKRQVAGYTSWQRNFDRQVMKGEKGIKMLAPAPYKAQ